VYGDGLAGPWARELAPDFPCAFGAERLRKEMVREWRRCPDGVLGRPPMIQTLATKHRSNTCIFSSMSAIATASLLPVIVAYNPAPTQQACTDTTYMPRAFSCTPPTACLRLAHHSYEQPMHFLQQETTLVQPYRTHCRRYVRMAFPLCKDTVRYKLLYVGMPCSCSGSTT